MDIILKPSKKFLMGNVYLSHLYINGDESQPFILSDKMTITSMIYRDDDIDDRDGRNGRGDEDYPYLLNLKPGNNFDINTKNIVFKKDKIITHERFAIIHIIIDETTPLPLLPLPLLPNFSITFGIKEAVIFPMKNIWDIRDSSSLESLNSFVYPTGEIPPQITAGKLDIGICFSGGGPRSFSATLGQLRALKFFENGGNKIDFLSRVKYISGISGSTWALIPFTYLPTNINDTEFLGYSEAGKLTLDGLKYSNPNYLANSLVKATNTNLLLYVFECFKYIGVGEKTRIWCYLLGQLFLRPFGIYTDNFYSYNAEYIKDVYGVPPLSIQGEDFTVIHDNDRPFLMVNTCIVPGAESPIVIPDVIPFQELPITELPSPSAYNLTYNTDFKHMVFTPLYTGTPNKIIKNNVEYGGEYYNAYSFHGYTYSKNDSKSNLITATLPTKNNLTNINRFNLFDIMGTSSSAYGIITEKLGLGEINPSYRIYPTSGGVGGKAESFSFADGGILDNTGILPLLQQSVGNIVLFINTSTPITRAMSVADLGNNIDIMLRQLFLGECDANSPSYLGYYKFINRFKVFENGGGDWNRLIAGFKDNLDKYDTAFAEISDVATVENTEFGIPKYVVKRLMVIYLYAGSDWYKDRLDDDVRKLLATPDYSNFPYYDTLFEDRTWISAELLQLKLEKINLLADLTSWNIWHNPIINGALKSLTTSVPVPLPVPVPMPNKKPCNRCIIS